MRNFYFFTVILANVDHISVHCHTGASISSRTWSVPLPFSPPSPLLSTLFPTFPSHFSLPSPFLLSFHP